MANVPSLQIPEGWPSRVPEGWDWSELWTCIEKGKHKIAHEIVQKAIDTGIHPNTILDDGLFPGFNLQGERFSEQIIFIPEMLITARAMKTGLALIRPLLAAAAEKPVGTFIIGTVLGDMHDIGQTIVTIMLENAGFRAINLGTDTHPDKFIAAARDEKADLVGFSLPADIVRAKGFMTIAGQPRTVQFAAGQLEITSAANPRNLSMVFISSGEPDRATVEAGLTATARG